MIAELTEDSGSRDEHPVKAMHKQSVAASIVLIILMVLLESVNKVSEHVSPVLEMPEMIV